MQLISESAFIQQMQASFNKFPKSVILEAGKSDAGKIEEQVNQIDAYAQSLYKKYEAYVGDMPDGWMKKTAVILMDNWHKATAKLAESTKVASIANFDKYSFPLIRALLPEMGTERMFTIQPMLGPTSVIFFKEPVYGTTTGKVTAGQSLYNNLDANYGTSDVDSEALATGDGTTATKGSGTLASTPIIPGSLSLTDGVQVAGDDGVGGLTGDATGTINYNTGALAITWAVAPESGAPIEGSWSVDTEANEAGIPEIDMVITSTPIIARSKKLKYRWSIESQFALLDNFGLEAEAELTTDAAAEIAYGIDNQNVRSVVKVAMDKTTDSDFTFPKTPPTGVSFTEHKHSLVDYLITGSSFILKQSGRAIGNWVLGDENFTNIVESLAPRFKAVKMKATRGIHYIGTLDDRWDILKIINPENIGLNTKEYLMGYKPDSFLNPGAIWAPWIAAFTTPTTMLDDMQGRKGMASLYAWKIINNKFYLKMKIGA